MQPFKSIKVYESKTCFHCHGSITKKNGFKNGKQQYKCYVCGKHFLGGNRISKDVLWHEYTEGKQTYTQLSTKYQCTIKTIQRKLDAFEVSVTGIVARSVVVLMDTTYWGRGFGVMLFKDAITK